MSPYSSSRHTLTEESDLVYGSLRPCTGGHTPMEEEADLVYDGLRPCVGRHMLGKQDDHDEVKDSLTAAKRKADGCGRLLSLHQIYISLLASSLLDL